MGAWVTAEGSGVRVYALACNLENQQQTTKKI